jgi:hypothetical protein
MIRNKNIPYYEDILKNRRCLIMSHEEKANILIEALKVLTKDEDLRQREIVRDLLVKELKMLTF